MLKRASTPYRTGMVGKWHCGTMGGFRPTDRGFDSYFGIPYSIDMGCAAQPSLLGWDCAARRVMVCPACAIDPAPVPPDLPADASCGRTAGTGCPHADLGLPLLANHTIVAQPVDLTQLSDLCAPVTY